MRDLVDDVLIEVAARRGRALLMMSGVALSTGALVAALGISATASRQIAADLAAATLDEVVVAPAPAAAGEGGPGTDPEAGGAGAPADGVGASGVERVFPVDAEARARDVELVRAAGLVLDLSVVADVEVRRAGPAAPDTDVPVLAAGSGYLDAAHARTSGASTWLLDQSHPAVFVGTDAAGRLGLPVVADPTGLQLWVDGAPVPVAGYVDGTADLRAAVVLPYAAGLERTGSDRSAQLLVRTEPGAGAPVARVVRAAVRPDRPEQLTTSQVVSLASLRHGVATQLGRMVGTVGLLLLALTVLLIANAMVGSVVARTPEIGLRRALGFSRADVAAVVWGEGALTGFLGGCAGGALASVVVVAVAAANRWTPSLGLTWVLLSPVLGAAVGVLASVQPALRAGRVSPATAVRAD